MKAMDCINIVDSGVMLFSPLLMFTDFCCGNIPLIKEEESSKSISCVLTYYPNMVSQIRGHLKDLEHLEISPRCDTKHVKRENL